MKKPSRVIALALLRTYGRNERSLFMCIAIRRLLRRGIINQSEATQACEAVMEFVRSYDPYEGTLYEALLKRGKLPGRRMNHEWIKVTRRLYIKHAIKLFFKGL